MYTLEQAQVEADLITRQLSVEGDGGEYTHEEYDAAEAVTSTQIVAFPTIINNLVVLFNRNESRR